MDKLLMITAHPLRRWERREASMWQEHAAVSAEEGAVMTYKPVYLCTDAEWCDWQKDRARVRILVSHPSGTPAGGWLITSRVLWFADGVIVTQNSVYLYSVEERTNG